MSDDCIVSYANIPEEIVCTVPAGIKSTSPGFTLIYLSIDSIVPC